MKKAFAILTVDSIRPSSLSGRLRFMDHSGEPESAIIERPNPLGYDLSYETVLDLHADDQDAEVVVEWSERRGCYILHDAQPIAASVDVSSYTSTDKEPALI